MIEINTSRLYRIAYSTDASAYREMPLGVSYPVVEQDIIDLVNYAIAQKETIIPRAGGTSLAGQVVGSGIVADISRYFNNIIEINAAEHWARVQPGVVLDELNIACKKYGLFFGPETSTSNRCCMGGMVGNNSCGSHSLVYGSTRHHLLEAKVILSDGSIEHFRDFTIAELEQRFGLRFWENNSTESIHSFKDNSTESSVANNIVENKTTSNTVTKHTVIEKIYAQLINFSLNPDAVKLIEDNFPCKSLQRRNCGYAIDEVIEGLLDESTEFSNRKINLCKILAGSEGTLCFATELKLNLVPLPPKEKVVVCAHCDTLDKSFLANLVALKFKPVAIELIDSNILELSKQNLSQQKNRFFIKGDPAAILIIELAFDTKEQIESVASDLEQALMNSNNLPDALVYHCSRVYGEEISCVWALRKAGLGLLSGMKGDAKPISVIEDTAVTAERLPYYMKDFGQMLSDLGLSCVYHAHIATGELHLRPILDIKNEQDRALFRELAYRTAVLVRKHRGSLSGEHGDGRLRGEFIRVVYGDYVYELMRSVKACWDNNGVFNLGKITDTPPMDSCLRYDVGQCYAIEQQASKTAFKNKDFTYFNWKASFDNCSVKGSTGAKSNLHALMCSIEQCNGAGDCRKSSVFGGTMCPSFKFSGNELMATRARANVLREILTRGSDIKGENLFSMPELKEVLDSCLACKACKSECPSNIDMTSLRAEILQHHYNVCGTPFRVFMVSRMAMVQRLGSYITPLYNFFATWNPSQYIIKKLLNFSADRQIPTLSRFTARHLISREKKTLSVGKKREYKGKVLLFVDEFTNYSEADLGLAFAKLLLNLGYEVEVPKHCESGRAAISKGCLKLAKKLAQKNVNLLSPLVSEKYPLIGIEPSCILSFRDEYPNLVEASSRDKAVELGRNCLLYDEFIMREIAAGRISATDFNTEPMEVWLHGHCHQKALVGIEKTVAMLRLLPNCKVNVIPSACCGMAGSFGYEAEHYKTSLAMGEMVLFPTVRKAMGTIANNLHYKSCISDTKTTPVIVCAPGTSCRQQIFDGTGIKAVHPIELMTAKMNLV